MEERDPERCEAFRERARLVAPRFALWFDREGHALPYGRSLAYRFAESAFFAMLALDGQETEAVNYGVMKRILLGNIREWFKRPIFARDGILTIGYGYPNLIMGEGYNAPGSPYWAMKAFAVLALPGEHPFWQAEEKAFVPGMDQFLDSHARLLLTMARDGSHVQAFAAGNHAEGHAHDDAKYEKFCYSTAFAFSVPKSSTLLMRGAYDSMLAFSEDDKMWHPRYGVESYALQEDRVRFTWKPFRGVTVDTTLYPVGEWHVRVHRVTSDRPVLAAEGGYAIRREDGKVAVQTEAGYATHREEEKDAFQTAQSGTATLLFEDGKDMLQTEERVRAVQGNGKIASFRFEEASAFAYAHAPWGASGIMALRGYDRGEALAPEPNTNLLYPRTVIPTLHAVIPAGETLLVCAVLGAVKSEMWQAMPKEEDIRAAMGE